MKTLVCGRVGVGRQFPLCLPTSPTSFRDVSTLITLKQPDQLEFIENSEDERLTVNRGRFVHLLLLTVKGC